jgi:uncharacterized protein (TIGR02284 family)
MTNQNQQAIDQLNSYLRGEMSAVETYHQALEKAKDPRAQSILRENESSHASRVQMLRDEVRRLGGEPAEGSGVWGAFAKAVEGGAKVFGESTAVAALEEGEDHGLKQYSTDDKDLPTVVLQTVSSKLLPAQRRTHDALANLKKLMA